MPLEARVLAVSRLCIALVACSSDDGVGAGGGDDGGVDAAAASGGAPGSGGGAAGDRGGTGAGGEATSASGGAEAGAGGASPGSGGAPPAPACPPTASLTPGETTRTIQVDGMSRSYILHVPPGYAGQAPVPLVVDFHPILANAAIERGSSGYGALADQEGFVVAWPDGIDNAWNVGPCCTRSRTVDDVAFARALAAEVEGLGCIDAKRVYATGYSMGGGMSHHVACHAADVFAAVAPSAFDLLEENAPDCVPARPISVMSFRGAANPIVPYGGGASNPPNGLPVTIHFLGAEDTLEKWKALNGCTGTPTVSGQCQTYSACSAGVEVTLCTAPLGGHVTGDARLGWEMMKRHPMP